MSDICVRPYLNGEELWVAEAHRRIYAEEYQWGPEFSDYAAKVALDFASKPKSPREELWVAESKGDLIGSIMLCQTEDISTGQIRLFLVEQAYRRLGVGAALTRTLMDKAKEAGYKALTLWTASPLTDAIRCYEKMGFRQTEHTPNTLWSLTGETVYEIKMDLDMTGDCR